MATGVLALPRKSEKAPVSQQQLSYTQLRNLQITLVVITGAIGMATGVLLGKVFRFFNNRCVFDSKIQIEFTEMISTRAKVIAIKDGSMWADADTCHFINYEGIFVFISCFIWLWFYIHMENIMK